MQGEDAKAGERQCRLDRRGSSWSRLFSTATYQGRWWHGALAAVLLVQGFPAISDALHVETLASPRAPLPRAASSPLQLRGGSSMSFGTPDGPRGAAWSVGPAREQERTLEWRGDAPGLYKPSCSPSSSSSPPGAIRFNLAILHFGGLALAAAVLHARSQNGRMRLLLRSLVLSNLVLALGGVVGRHGDILGFPLFAILAMLRAVASPALLPLALPLLAAASERSNTRVPLGPTAAALLAVALSVLGGYTTLSHILFRAEMRPDPSFLSLGLVRYYPHPQAPAFAMLVPPLILVAAALTAGVQMYRKCSTVVLLAGAAGLFASIVGRAEAVVWSAPVGEVLFAAALFLVSEVLVVGPTLPPMENAGKCHLELGGTGVIRLMLSVVPGLRSLPANAPRRLFDLALVLGAMALPRATARFALALAEQYNAESGDSRRDLQVGGRHGGGDGRMDVRIAANTLVLNTGPLQRGGTVGRSSGGEYDRSDRFEEVESSEEASSLLPAASWSLASGAGQNSAGSSGAGQPSGAGTDVEPSESSRSASPKEIADREMSDRDSNSPSPPPSPEKSRPDRKSRKPAAVKRISLRGVGSPLGNARWQEEGRGRNGGEQPSTPSAAGLAQLTQKFLSGYAGVQSGNGKYSPVAPRKIPSSDTDHFI